MIGVTGSKEFNEFEIIASIITPNTITPISLGNGKINCHVFDGNYRFFSVKIDPRQRGKIVINMGTENGTDGYGGKNDFDTENDRFSYSKLQNYGRGKLLHYCLNNCYLLLLYFYYLLFFLFTNSPA